MNANSAYDVYVCVPERAQAVVCLYAHSLQVNHSFAVYRLYEIADAEVLLLTAPSADSPPSPHPPHPCLPPFSLPSLKLSLHLSQGARTLPIKSAAKKEKEDAPSINNT